MLKKNLNNRLAELAAASQGPGKATPAPTAQRATVRRATPTPPPKVAPAPQPIKKPTLAGLGKAVVRSAAGAGERVINAMIDAWSYSRLSDWRKCPRMAYYKHVLKMKEPGNKHTLRGIEVHKQAQDFVEGKLPSVPAACSRFTAGLKKLRKDKAVCETEWAFGPDWSEQTWFAKLYRLLRVKTDVCAVYRKGAELHVVDHKTGRVNPDHEEQLSLYATAAMVKYPSAKKVLTELWYHDSGEKVSQEFTREDLPGLKKYWEETTDAMFADRAFQCKPGDACRFCWFRKENPAPGAPRNCKY